uniref:Uncharacterized protein n=1 Tax=Arundo donax TaxID=35708 RepID=A0A0A8ZEQ1_ARUDO
MSDDDIISCLTS